MSPQIRSRWIANLAAAGIQADDETLKRVEPAAAARLDDLRGALHRLDYRGENPDYLRETTTKEHTGGDA